MNLSLSLAGCPEDERTLLSASSRAKPACLLIFSSSAASFQYGRAKRGVRAKGAAALQALRELVGLAKVFQRVWIIHDVVEAALAQRVPGIDAEGPAVRGAAQRDFSLAALVAHHGEALRRGAVAKG